MYRESSRSGRWSSKATRDLRAGGPLPTLLSLFLPLSTGFALSSPPLSPLPPLDLFIPFSVASSLSSSTSSLFLSFCPFSASANDSRLFISRLYIARGRARVLSFAFVRYCRCRRRSSRSRSLSPPPSSSSSSSSSFSPASFSSHVTYVTSRHLVNHILRTPRRLH